MTEAIEEVLENVLDENDALVEKINDLKTRMDDAYDIAYLMHERLNKDPHLMDDDIIAALNAIMKELCT